MLPSVKEMSVSHESTLEEVLKILDKTAQGICFVVEDNESFLGVITDGDVRRSLLKGFDLKSKITNIVNRTAITLPFGAPTEIIQKNLTSAVRHIPLLDHNKKIVDYSCSHRLHRIPVMEPHLGGNELAYVTECIKSGWISSKGSFVTSFETEISKVCDMPYTIAVSNGTTALHLALVALGIGVGDEVIVPDFTFAASINAILYTGATPVIVDIEPVTWTIDVQEIKKSITSKTKAIMPVHIYGHPCDMDGIMSLANEFKLLVVEDCAEALGSTYRGRPVGSFGDASTFSFFGNKVITTGEGGMVIFKEKKNYEFGKILRDHGMSPTKRYWHDVLGYNYRMTNLQAAVGVAQMEQFNSFLTRRSKMAIRYDQGFSSIPEIFNQPTQEWATSCHWLYTIIIGENVKIDRDDLINKLMMNGIETRPTFYPLHEMELYSKYGLNKEFPVSKKISQRGICLPSSVTILDNEIDMIVYRIKSLVEMGEFNERGILG